MSDHLSRRRVEELEMAILRGELQPAEHAEVTRMVEMALEARKLSEQEPRDRNREMIAGRLDYEDKIMRVADPDFNGAVLDESVVLDELAQFLVDMMDHCEQTLLAEPSIKAAHIALLSMRRTIALIRDLR